MRSRSCGFSIPPPGTLRNSPVFLGGPDSPRSTCSTRHEGHAGASFPRFRAMTGEKLLPRLLRGIKLELAPEARRRSWSIESAGRGALPFREQEKARWTMAALPQAAPNSARVSGSRAPSRRRRGAPLLSLLGGRRCRRRVPCSTLEAKTGTHGEMHGNPSLWSCALSICVGVRDCSSPRVAPDPPRPSRRATHSARTPHPVLARGPRCT